MAQKLGRTRSVVTALLWFGCSVVALAGGSHDNHNVTTVTADGWESFLQGQAEKKRHVLVMFHVGWCKACQRTFPLFAASSDLVFEKEVPMEFAHVDCTDDKTMCKLFEVNGYPTLKLFSPEEGKASIVFRGARTVPGFLKYAQRMTSAPLRSFQTLAEWEQALKDETFSGFVARQKSAAVKELAERWMDRHLFTEASDLATLLPQDAAGSPEEASLAVISSPAQQWKGAENSSKPKVSYYSGDADNLTAMSDWIEGHRFPGVWYLEAHNFFEFTHSERPCVLVAVGKEVSAELAAQIRGAQEAFKGSHYFGVLNGSQWSEELRVFNLLPEELPRILYAEKDFNMWVEDVAQLRAESLEADLRRFVAGEVSLLRQDRTMLSKLFFWKREGWRYSLRMLDYAGQGKLQAASVFAGAMMVLLLGFIAFWLLSSCCRLLLLDDEPEALPTPDRREAALAATQKKHS